VTRTAWWRRFLVRGVFWRQFLRWAVLNIPIWVEPAAIAWWSLLFLLWGPGRRGVMRNLTAIKPGSWSAVNFLRCYRVFWNYAWTITDNVRFKELHVVPDWEFTGWRAFETMQASGGAILLTAHMGSYDLGAHLFSETSGHRVIVVRAPESDPQTRAFESTHQPDGVRVAFNVNSTDLAIDLLHAIRDGEIIAVQGDRVTEGITALPATLFGRPARVPAGPFALALATGAPIYPIFIIRGGRRRYRLLACEPISVRRTRSRDEALAAAVAVWTGDLEHVIRTWWYQWFQFEPYAAESES